MILLKPLADVFAPYRDLRDAMLLIDGLALVLAAVIGAVLGRSATRPIGELVRAAQRIERGDYQTAVSVAGGDEFRALATTFNTMQHHIAAREADITYQAEHDPLTQLPNRALAQRELSKPCASEADEHAGALILIELRNLRDINASLGHQVGDEVLREAARRLQQNVAAADTVARVGETQFLVIAPRLLRRARAAVCRAARRRDPQRLSHRRRQPRPARGVRACACSRRTGGRRRNCCSARRWRSRRPTRCARAWPSTAPARTASIAAG